MRITHSFTDDSATIRIEGPAPGRMLHLTDTHACPVCGRSEIRRGRRQVELRPL